MVCVLSQSRLYTYINIELIEIMIYNLEYGLCANNPIQISSIFNLYMYCFAKHIIIACIAITAIHYIPRYLQFDVGHYNCSTFIVYSQSYVSSSSDLKQHVDSICIITWR